MNTSLNLHFRRLNSDEDFQHFALKYLESEEKRRSDTMQKDGALIALEYLRKAQVFGVFDSNNRMLAGYIINVRQPFRLLSVVPSEPRSAAIIQYKKIFDHACELTCTWRLPEVSSVFMSSRFWPHAFFNLATTGKRFFLGASANPGLEKLYTQAGQRTLYMGPITVHGITLRIFYYNRFGLLLGMFRILAIETPKRLLKQWHKKLKMKATHETS